MLEKCLMLMDCNPFLLDDLVQINNTALTYSSSVHTALSAILPEGEKQSNKFWNSRLVKGEIPSMALPNIDILFQVNLFRCRWTQSKYIWGWGNN